MGRFPSGFQFGVTNGRHWQEEEGLQGSEIWVLISQLLLSELLVVGGIHLPPKATALLGSGNRSPLRPSY